MNLQPELGSGPLDAALWIVARDDARWQANDGFLLDSTLKQAGMSRAGVRLEALCATGNWAQDTWRLGALLEAQKPKLILALGDDVNQFVVGAAWPEDGVQAARGYLWDTRFGRALTSIEPHDFNRPAKGGQLPWTPWRALLNLDMKRAASELAAGCPPLEHREVTIVTDIRQLDDLRDCIAEARWYKNNPSNTTSSSTQPTTRLSGAKRVPVLHVRDNSLCGWLAVDIENHADLTLACVGFAPSPQRAWVIPASEAWQLAAIRELCESSVPKVLQNGQYDRFFLRRFAGIELRNQVFDTQLAWHALQPELAGKKLHTSARRKAYSRTTVKSLKFLSSIYTRDAWWKNYDFASEEERYILCGWDCCVTLDIALKQAAQLESA